MKYEISAGGIITNLSDKKIYILLIKDKSGNWTFPKGLVERDEKNIDTAIREVKEEVGIKHLELVSELAPIRYYYRWEDELIFKTVYYFLFKSRSHAVLTPQIEEGIMEAKWFTIESIDREIGYKKTNLPLFKQVKGIIKEKYLDYDPFVSWG